MVRRLALLAVLALTACSAQPNTPAPIPSATPTVVPLTAAQATKAALRITDLPKGWEAGVAPDPIATLGIPIKYKPVECQLLRDALQNPASPPTTSIRGHYLLRADNPNDDKVAAEVIASWPTSQLPLLRRIAEALPHCATFAGSIEGESFNLFARQLPMAGLRDGIVLRFGDPNDPKLKSGAWRAYVVRGGTVLGLTAGSDTFSTDAAFARFVTTAVARLDAVVG